MVRLARIAIRFLLLVGTCTAFGPRLAAADVDATGKWLLDLGGIGQICLDFTQAGSAITAVQCDGSGPTYTGTINPATGVFDMSQPTTPCSFFDNGWCEVDGTVAPPSNSMSGNYFCYFFKETPPVGCFGYGAAFTGQREHCGDSYVNSATEQCDVGIDNDDCCDPSCQLSPDGTPCSDDTEFTTNDMCSAGTCIGSTSGTDFQINTYTTQAQVSAAVACGLDGGYVATWTGTGAADNYGIFGRRYDSNGAAIGTEFPVNTYTTGVQGDSAVAAAPNGDITVVWTDGAYPQVGRDGDSYAIYAQRFASTGALAGSDFQVNTYTTSAQEGPDIASLDGSRTVMVWSSYGQDGDGFGVFGRIYDNNGVPLGTEFQVNSYTTGSQEMAAVAADGTGGFAVVWKSGGIATPGGVVERRYDSSGLPVGSDVTVSSFVPDSQTQPDVAVDAAGNVVVAWYQGANIWARRYFAGGIAAGTEFQVNTYTTCFNSNPSATMNADGSFVIAWENGCQDGSNSGIFAKRYRASGTQDGLEFLVNAYTTSWQGAPAVCSTADGGFLAAWESGQQDGSSDGIFGRRFPAPIVPPVDHYKCYEGIDLKTPVFDSLDAVATSDQIGSGPVDVRKLKFICTPVDKNGEGINDPAAHLACYQVTAANLAPRPQVQVSTQFQTTRFELRKAKLLCVPATKVLLP